MRSTRIFWLGAHKVLKRTELRDLRAMGLEVFNPAYVSPVFDQSADRRIDRDQPTTLPPDVFATLLAYDFFYRPIEPGIAELLNEWFDAVIVTINPDWLRQVLAVFEGRVIWRVYGQPYSLSETILHYGLWRAMIEHPNLVIVPFAAESVENEHRWFLDLCHEAVPYQIPDDTFARSGTWATTRHRPEIAVSLPNVQNPYYAAAYDAFNGRYPHRLFRIYGPQRQTPPDSRFVGALARDMLLERFAASSGYLYDYRDDVAYLPPIEFMEVGGPVIYAPGSLLSRMYGERTPGLIRGAYDAEQKIGALLKGDAGFVHEVVAAQETVRRRYDPKVVRPLFEAAFSALLANDAPDDAAARPATRPAASSATVASSAPSPAPSPVRAPRDSSRGRFVILLHIDGLFGHRKGRVYAFEGIPRVVDMIVGVLIRFSDMELSITCTRNSEPALYDLLRDPIRAGRLNLVPIECGAGVDEVPGYCNRLEMVAGLNRDAPTCVLVPHYYLFPEALLLTAPVMLYLPDYFPHLMPERVFDSSPEKDAENRDVGIAIARKAVSVLTNSFYTAAYLPDAGFVDAASSPGTSPATSKVCVAPLPLLGATRAEPVSPQDAEVLRGKVAGRRYVFYPTANRPNKQIPFLLRVFAAVRARNPDLLLVLTCDLDSVPGTRDVWASHGLQPHVLFTPGLDEPSLRWYYENSAAMCLTSTAEGNFPPQVLEAVVYDTPVVATRLPTITEALEEAAEDMLLCNPLDFQEFCDKLEAALADRAGTVARQSRLKGALGRRASPETFYAAIEPVLRPLLARTRSRGRAEAA